MASSASALFYLWSRSLANLVLGRLRRPKQPKYLFGAVLALAYLYFLFIYPTLVMDRPNDAAADAPEHFGTLVALAMLVFFLLSWVWWRKRMALQLTDAEIAFLLPGPISHAALVHYHLVRGQAGMLVSATIFTLISQNWDSITSPLPIRFVGWWILLAGFYLYVSASGFTLTRLQDRGLAPWRRQLLLLALLVFVGWLTYTLDPHLRLPALNETTPPSAFSAYLRAQTGSGTLYWLLLPFRALFAPMLAVDPASFVRALGPALAILAVLYLWAFASAAPDPEGAIDAAAKRAGLIAAFRKGNLTVTRQTQARADPFRLGARGSPVVAILWKNLLSTREYFRLRTFVGIAAMLVVWDWWQQSPPRYPVAAAIVTLVALVTAGQVLLLGAQLARQDLRADMEHADLIKSWPLEGWQVVLGQLLAPTLILTGILWLCLLQIGLTVESSRLAWLTPQLRLTAGVSLAVLLPFLFGVQLLVVNAVVVLFGGWLKLSGKQQQGFEVGIQRMVFFIGQWLVMTVALVPGLLFGALIYIPFSWFIDVYAMFPAALVAALVMAAELAWGINWLGERFDAHDVTA